MPTPDPDDAVPVPPSPGYLITPMHDVERANEKPSAPIGAAAIAAEAPTTRQVTIEQIVNAVELLAQSHRSLEKKIADHAAQLAELNAVAAAPAVDASSAAVQSTGTVQETK